MIAKIATSAVYVKNQDDAIEFWGANVGFEIRRDLPMGPKARWVEMAPPGADTCIVIYPKSMMEDWAERKPSMVFECVDIGKTHAEMAVILIIRSLLGFPLFRLVFGGVSGLSGGGAATAAGSAARR